LGAAHVEDVGVFLAFQRGLSGLVLFEIVKVFQEQQPGRLLGVIELGGAPGFFPKDVIDVLESLFKHFVFRRYPSNTHFHMVSVHRIPSSSNLEHRVLFRGNY
jgi:hypothetical protein